MNLDPLFLDVMKGGGISGVLILIGLVVLSIQVRALQHAVDGVRETIGEKVFPRLDDHTSRISELEGRYAMWETMRRDGD